MAINHDNVLNDLWSRVRENIDTQIDKVKTTAQDTLSQAQALLEDMTGHEATAGQHADRAGQEADRAASAATNATTAEVNKLRGEAPEAFDTLGEIADELADNETDRAALANILATKADQAEVAQLLQEVNETITPKADTTYVDTELDKKADISYVDQEIEASRPTWGNIEGVPTEFPPETHTHTVGQVNGLDATLEDLEQRLLDANPTWDNIEGKPTEFTPASHRHAADEIDGLAETVEEAGPWVGTFSEYNAIASKDPDKLYFVTGP